MNILSENHLDRIEYILQENLIDKGISCSILIDMAGNIIANLGDGEKKLDIYSLAALAAGNYGAVHAMASIVGEDDFSLLFHKGKDVNIHFANILDDYLLITIFTNDLSLGFLRLTVANAMTEIKSSLNYRSYI